MFPVDCFHALVRLVKFTFSLKIVETFLKSIDIDIIKKSRSSNLFLNVRIPTSLVAKFTYIILFKVDNYSSWFFLTLVNYS